MRWKEGRDRHIEEPSSWVKDRKFIYILYACIQCLPFREAKCIELLIEKWASAMSQEWHKGKPEIPSPIEPTKYKICGCRFRKGEVPLLTIPGMVVLGGVFRSEFAWRSSTSFDPWPCWAEVFVGDWYIATFSESFRSDVFLSEWIPGDSMWPLDFF